MNALVYIGSFGITLVGMPLILRLAFAVGAVDQPDGVRKRHTRPTPRLGGLWVFSVFFVSACLCVPLSDGRFVALLSGGTLLVAAGVIDDTQDLPPAAKLCFQTVAALIALLFVRLPSTWELLGLSLTLPAWLSFALYLLFTVLVINAVNLIDGVDGLASGVMAVVLLGAALLAHARADAQGGTLALLLCVPLLAFLLYNRHPATVFLGDAGAQFLGLAAAVLLLPGQDDTPFPIGSVALLAVPLCELIVSIVRRLSKGQSPLRADDGHLHHRLLRNGMSEAAVVASYVLLSACAALVGYTLGVS
ncbi:MAG: undecaprenyl/decaprenyl-phosphate alpha-N-acetylglucosaminyl 1-phosphate transferase [Clostridia bacterium]|nr:undecaprenyl/decaprenyl-phosphate alpha-N-acetylglucosaminyl 1-phosphate transferase [Clostridia bacterium]